MMKNFFLIGILVILILSGCGSSATFLPPVLGTPGPDIFPCLFTYADLGSYAVNVAYYDEGAATWGTNSFGNDFLSGTIPNNHNRIVYETSGQWGAILIEDTGHLELWQDPGVWAWNGTLAKTSDEIANSWVDADFVSWRDCFSGFGVNNSTSAYYLYIQPNGAATFNGITFVSGIGSSFTVTRDRQIVDQAFALMDTSPTSPIYMFNNGTYNTSPSVFTTSTKQQIITDNFENIIFFSMPDATSLLVNFTPDIITIIDNGFSQLIQEYAIAGTNTIQAFKVAGKFDIHLVTMESVQNTGPRTYDFYIKYYRRENATTIWSSGVTLETWNIPDAQASSQTARNYVQLSVDESGRITIFYTKYLVSPTSKGDLCGAYIWDPTLYDDYATAGNWTLLTNLDNSTNDILCCNALADHP